MNRDMRLHSNVSSWAYIKTYMKLKRDREVNDFLEFIFLDNMIKESQYKYKHLLYKV